MNSMERNLLRLHCTQADTRLNSTDSSHRRAISQLSHASTLTALPHKKSHSFHIRAISQLSLSSNLTAFPCELSQPSLRSNLTAFTYEQSLGSHILHEKSCSFCIRAILHISHTSYPTALTYEEYHSSHI
jgi:hypothetical protein